MEEERNRGEKGEEKGRKEGWEEKRVGVRLWGYRLRCLIFAAGSLR